MSKSKILLPVLVAASAVVAGAQSSPASTRVGVIHIQQAIVSTVEGKKAAGELQQRYDPRRKEIEEKQKEIAALRDQLQKGSNTMSDQAKQTLALEIDQKTKSLNRAAEDAQADWQQDQNRILQELGQRMMVVIKKYAQDNSYSVILDISAPETPVLWASNAVDITNDIVSLYDKNAPSPAAAPAKPAAPPSAGRPAMTPPVKPPASPPKKQP